MRILLTVGLCLFFAVPSFGMSENSFQNFIAVNRYFQNPDFSPYTPNYLLILSLKRLDLSLVKDIKSRHTLAELLDDGLIEDIAASEFIIRDTCSASVEGKLVVRSASTVMEVKKSPVCIAPGLMARQIPFILDEEQITGFLVHEFAHHFGLSDEDFSLAKSVSDALYLQGREGKRRRSLEGEVSRTKSFLQRCSGNSNEEKLRRCFQENNCQKIGVTQEAFRRFCN